MWFLWNRSSYTFTTCTIVIGTPENVSMHWVWPSKYKGKWSFSPKCGFSETGHHTPLLLVPLWLTHLKMSACTEFGPLNTKESDVFAHNVVSNRQIIIQLWNLVPLWLAHLKTLRCTEFGPLNTKESDVLAQNVVSLKQIIIHLYYLYHYEWHTWKPQDALSLAL